MKFLYYRTHTEFLLQTPTGWYSSVR